MMVAYAQTYPAGESITTLTLAYNPSPTMPCSGTLDVGYEGFSPPVSHLRLSWTGEARVLRGGVPLTSGSLVTIETLEVEIISGPVTFSLSDDVNYFLVASSVRGVLIYPEFDILKSTRFYQRLVIGAAQFAKVSTSIVVDGDRLTFTNFFASARMPDTFWLSANKYLITGAIIMLASLSILFALGVKPSRQEADYVNTMRLVSVAGKRSNRGKYRNKPRE